MTKRGLNIATLNVNLSSRALEGSRFVDWNTSDQNHPLSIPIHKHIEASIRGDRTAQKAIYQALLPYLRAVARRYLRNDSYLKDALQEAFVKIFRKLEQYDAKKGSLKTWSARLVINTCLNYNERVIGEQAEEFQTRIHDIPLEASPAESITDDDLLRVVKQMPYNYYRVFNLHVIDGYSHKEIEQILNISEAVSRKQLSRARAWLKGKGASIFNQSQA